VKNEIDVWKSPLNRRVILGETFVTGHFSEREKFQSSEDLAAAGLNSVLFVSLNAGFEVIGVLGAYSERTDQFEEDDIEFFRLAADVVAIAIANARAYEAVETLIQERSQFMLQIAHNLRAPLAATISMVEVVQDGYLGELNEKQREHLGRIDRRAKSMAAMINELLALARSRAGTRKAERASVDLRVLAGRLERTFQDEAAEKGLGLEVVVPEGLPETTGDAEMLEQMFENLISNALKYTRAGSVRIAFAVEPDGMIRIEVQDTGIGIPTESMPRLFTEFYRAPNARSVDAVGTGLGLALVKETVDRHRGRIRVESEEGRGTTFVVHLPTSTPDITREVQP
jgi:signal transduction histidine kinase